MGIVDRNIGHSKVRKLILISLLIVMVLFTSLVLFSLICHVCKKQNKQQISQDLQLNIHDEYLLSESLNTKSIVGNLYSMCDDSIYGQYADYAFGRVLRDYGYPKKFRILRASEGIVFNQEGWYEIERVEEFELNPKPIEIKGYYDYNIIREMTYPYQVNYGVNDMQWMDMGGLKYAFKDFLGIETLGNGGFRYKTGILSPFYEGGKTYKFALPQFKTENNTMYVYYSSMLGLLSEHKDITIGEHQSGPIAVKMASNFTLGVDDRYTNVVGQDDISPMYYFDGVFDGDGHTIAFQGIFSWHYNETVSCTGFKEAYSPFLQYLGNNGWIKNIKFDFSLMQDGNGGILIDGTYGGAGSSYVGGIVGNSKGYVSNCMVHSPTVISTRHNSFAHFSAIVGICGAIVNGKAVGGINNCAVTGEYVITANDSSGINAYWATIPTVSAASAVYCVYTANVVEIKNNNKDLIRSPLDLLSSTNHNSTQLKYEDDSRESYDVFNGGDKKVDKYGYTSLKSISSVGGGYKETTYYWYYSFQYSDVPLLRIFMTWKELEFKSSDNSKGSISVSKILIPDDADDLKRFEVSTLEIEVFNQTCVVELKVDACAVREWLYSKPNGGIDTFTVYFSNETCVIKFMQETSAYGEVMDSSGFQTFIGQEYTVAKGSFVTLELDPCGDYLRIEKYRESYFYVYNRIVIKFSYYNPNKDRFTDIQIILEPTTRHGIEVLAIPTWSNYESSQNVVIDKDKVFYFGTLLKSYDIKVI